MGDKNMSKDDWRNVFILIYRGIDQCYQELSEFEGVDPFEGIDLDLIGNKDDRDYVMDRLADIKSGRKAIDWIKRRTGLGL